LIHFLEIPKERTKFSSAKVVVIPVPYEETTSYGKGAKFGPKAILEASKIVEDYDIELGFEPQQKTGGIHTFPFITGKKDIHKKVFNAIKRALSKDKFFVVLGGEHSISYGAVKATKEFYPNLSVLQFDAHADLRDSYLNNKHSHACIMRRISPMCPFVQVGIRSQCLEEKEYIEEYSLEKKVFYAHEYDDSKTAKIVEHLTDNVYITFDVDCLDPSIMPSTGTPEPGGLLWYQVLKILRLVFKKRNVVGVDIVELAPIRGIHFPEYTIAKLVYKIIGYYSEKI